MIKTILTILFFAIATMILYSWGYIKEQRIHTDLTVKLYNKAEKRVINAMKRNEALTRREIMNILSNLKTSKFGSRRKLVVTDAESFTKGLLDRMTEKGLLDINYKTKPITYSLKEKR